MANVAIEILAIIALIFRLKRVTNVPVFDLAGHAFDNPVLVVNLSVLSDLDL
jgi:hypothetical protein